MKILTNKNIIHPELIKKHFDTFIKMNDKELVKVIMKDFCQICAYIGFYDGIDVEKLAVIFRRIFKTPEEV